MVNERNMSTEKFLFHGFLLYVVPQVDKELEGKKNHFISIIDEIQRGKEGDSVLRKRVLAGDACETFFF